MNVKVCDICFYLGKRKKLVESKYKASWSGGVSKIALDLCEEHKDYLKKFKNYEDAQKDLTKLQMDSYPEVKIGKIVEATLSKPQ